MTTSGGKGEKILVSVRVRPRNDKEKTRNDICDWECVNNTTIICNNNLPERSLFPSTYTFGNMLKAKLNHFRVKDAKKTSFEFFVTDKVFGFDSPTKQVYEDGAKEVALCVLEGINSSIFAYGQTSSGKTYTMSGITEFAMNDIFCYIQKHKEREFTLKFSAIEIYNEAVRDLLSGDNNQLRLLDDPERGTVVEKLIEETLRDRTHLEELLSICETQRKIGETSLNETSSRSHQILRLTIESSGREFSLESSRTLAASVCFVDLAGSERASQTLSAGARLKEGCHINRSLLTLGTVIRKLSKGRNGGHIPYRDSKLTRILQNSLGGNARTAIICTMSPARSHVEQSRNTLLFATCAKEVTTNAQVNLVVSEKALVKQLQQELARMENELKNIGSSSSAGSEFYSLLKQKEEVISQMEEQMKELKWQRDVAQSRVETLLKATAEERSSRMDEHSMLSSMDFDADLRRRSYDSIDIGEPSTVNNFTERNFELFENPEEDDFLVEDNIPQFSRYNLYNGWEEIVQTTNSQKVEGEQSCVQAEPVESHDDIVDKKEETISSPEYQPSDSSLMGNNEQEEVEISTPAEKENVDLSSPNAKPETSDLEMRSSVEVQETQKLVKEDEEEKKEERMTSSSTKQAEECSNKEEEEEDAQPEQQTKEHWELNSLPTKKQSEETVEVELVPDGAKLDEDDKYYSESSVYMSDDVDNSTYEALKEKVKEMQKKIEYLMSMHTAEQQQSPCFRRDYKSPDLFTTKRSRSCRENLLCVRSPLWFDNLEASNNASPSWRVRELNASPGRPMNKTTSISFDSGSSMSSTPIDPQSLKDCDPQTGNSFQEFVAGLQEMARQHSLDSTPGLDYGIEIKPESPANALPNPHNRNEETTNDQLEREQGDDLVEDAVPKETDSTDFERQQRQIIELWAVCNVPLVHRTYFFLLFKGDPSDYVYMEVELRRLSFLKQTINNDTETSRTQTVKALTREKEWLSKQIPKKFPWNQRIELYRKWGVEVNSKQRSLQVACKVWTNTQDTEHIKESASLVAKLLGFVEASRMPKEMFGLSLLPGTENVRSSGWRFTKSFSSMRLTGS
ncbi:unnamed protein product [Brassica rapa subsp. trilocularis]